VAFAGGAYVLTFMVYVLGMEKYHPIIRVTVLNGFLAYCFYAGALILELGKPWNIINPIIGNDFGLSSVLFLISWHFMLYIFSMAVEFSPAFAEWIGARRLRKILVAMTVGAVIFGVTLSTLHQSALGALFLMASNKIHPLWYSEFIPILFFISSIFAGLSMVVFEGSISRRVFKHRLSSEVRFSHAGILVGLARICAAVMFVYLFLELIKLVDGRLLGQLNGRWGLWYGVEMIALTAVPMVMFLIGSKRTNLTLIRAAAVMTMLGVVLNRLNISLIAFRWDSVAHYIPTPYEMIVSLSVIAAEIWVFRWIVLRMPVVSAEPDWVHEETDEIAPAGRAVA
jgi:Ni/Fe-hydrogenase subunit HybB-like protein